MKLFLMTAAVLFLAISSDANAKEPNATYFAKTRCPMTGAVGKAQAASAEVAKEAAIKNCITKGGLPICCNKYVHLIN